MAEIRERKTRIVSKHAETLRLLDNGKKIPPQGWHCEVEDCNLTDNLWMNLTDGAVRCGHRSTDGSEGNNHAVEHYKNTSFPLAVKLGTITSTGDADVYSYDEEDLVEMPNLLKHVTHFGINVDELVAYQVDDSLTQVEIDTVDRQDVNNQALHKTRENENICNSTEGKDEGGESAEGENVVSYKTQDDEVVLEENQDNGDEMDQIKDDSDIYDKDQDEDNVLNENQDEDNVLNKNENDGDVFSENKDETLLDKDQDEVNVLDKSLSESELLDENRDVGDILDKGHDGDELLNRSNIERNLSVKRMIEDSLDDDTDSPAAKRLAAEADDTELSAVDEDIMLLDSDEDEDSRKENPSDGIITLDDTSSITSKDEEIDESAIKEENISLDECNGDSKPSLSDNEDEKPDIKCTTIEEGETNCYQVGDIKQDVKTYSSAPSRSTDGKKICCNENCKNVNHPLVRAPSLALSFFCLQNSKNKVQRICSECLERAIDFTNKCKDAIKSETPVFNYKTEPRSVLTIHLDEESDEDSEEDLEMKEQIEVPDLENTLKATMERLHITFQAKECERIAEMEMNELEKEFEELDAQFNATSEIVEEARKTYLDITGPKIKPVVVSYVDIDANGDCHFSNNANDFAPKAKKHVAVKHTAQPPKVSNLNSRSSRSSHGGDDGAEVLEVNLVNRVTPHIQLSATPPVIPRVMPKVGDKVYGMHRSSLHYWLRGEILEINLSLNEYVVKFEPTKRGRPVRDGNKYDGGSVQQMKTLSSKHLAYNLPCPFILPVGTRVIAKFKDEFQTELEGHGHYYAGIVAEPPKNTNLYRYLVFFDDGYAQYVSQDEVLLVCESSKDVWLDVHTDSAEFIRNYVQKYPERPMVRLQKGSMVTTEWNGKWWVARVVELDCSLVKMHFESDSRYEWIYRGSTRLSPLFHKQERQMTSGIKSNVRRHNVSTASRNINQPTIEYMDGADDWRVGKTSVARKSTGSGSQRPEPQAIVGIVKKKAGPLSSAENRLIEFEGSVQLVKIPDHISKPKEFVTHFCDQSCVTPYNPDDKSLKSINPLALAIYLGWAREIAKAPRRTVFYRAPCGRRLRDYDELYRFLRKTNFGMGIDYFCFDFAVDCFHEFRPTRIIKQLKDLTYNKEPVKITCVNALDFDHPEYLEYSADRIPGKGVTINTRKEFLMCCECTDDCRDKSKCACWQLTISGISFTKLNNPDFPVKGYENRRLYDHIVSGIYECNDGCSCKKTCYNRVAQQPLKWHLQVFKTTSKGWGIRPLYDIPQGAFICIYAGQVLTEDGANEDGRNFGDEYLAELDWIEVNEQVKADYESDVTDIEDDKSNSDEDKRTIVTKTSSGRVVTQRRVTDDYDSDDEGRKRKPSKLAANPSNFAKKKKPKRLPTRELFGKDEQCYIMDAKSKGNIGRYLNHSCQPNVFVQNVFVDTHDLRFPWVAFFAFKHIRAGTELTWDYNYDIGSVPDKSMYCYCGAAECRGRLL